MKEKRYVVTVSLYMWAESDDEVNKQAEVLAKSINDKHDARCSVDEIVEQPQGTIGNREVKVK